MITANSVDGAETKAAITLQCFVRRLISARALRDQASAIYVLQKDEKSGGPTYYYNKHRQTRVPENAWHRWLKLGRLKKPSLRAREESQAVIRLQLAYRTFAARLRFRAILRDNFLKVYDSKVKEFYYVNSNTRQVLSAKPKFLSDNDIEVEHFIHRRAVCRIVVPDASERGRTASVSKGQNLKGQQNPSAPLVHNSAVLVTYHGLPCILATNSALGSVSVAEVAKAQFDYDGDPTSHPFCVNLRPDILFFSSDTPMTAYPSEKELNFSLVACDASTLDESGSARAISLQQSDAKNSCSADIRDGDPVEIVGHSGQQVRAVIQGIITGVSKDNQGKPTDIAYEVSRSLGMLVGAPIFRHGRLVGLHRSADELSKKSYKGLGITRLIAYIERAAVPEPPLIVDCLTTEKSIELNFTRPLYHTEIHGLESAFLLEMAYGDAPRAKEGSLAGGRNAKDLEFHEVYRGQETSFSVFGLSASTSYTFRLRLINQIARSKWSDALTVKTIPAINHPSLTTKLDGDGYQSLKVLMKHWQDPRIVIEATRALSTLCLGKSYRWRDEVRSTEKRYLDCVKCLVNILEQPPEIYDSEGRFYANIACILEAVCVDGGDLFPMRADSQGLLAALISFIQSCTVTRPRCLGSILSLVLELVSTCDMLKHKLLTLNGVQKLLRALEELLDFDDVVKEACRLIATLALNNVPFQTAMMEHGGLSLLSEVLTSAVADDFGVARWALLAVGNTLYMNEANKEAADRCELLDSVYKRQAYAINSLCRLKAEIDESERDLEDQREQLASRYDFAELTRLETQLQELKGQFGNLEREQVLQCANYAAEQIPPLIFNQKVKALRAAKLRIERAMLKLSLGKWVRVTKEQQLGHALASTLERRRLKQLARGFERFRAACQSNGGGFRTLLNRVRRKKPLFSTSTTGTSRISPEV